MHIQYSKMVRSKERCGEERRENELMHACMQSNTRQACMYLHYERAITLLVRRVRNNVRVASITQMVRASCDVED